LKENILKFISTLFEDETNIKNLVYKQNLLEYLKSILISLYDKIKIAIQEYKPISSFDDKVKIYVSCDIVDSKGSSYSINKFFEYQMKIIDISETPIINIACSYISKNFYDMNEAIAWRYTSLCRDFSYFEGLKYFLSNLSLIKSKGLLFDPFFISDLIVVISNSFELLKKLMESSFSLSIFNDQKEDIYYKSLSAVLDYFFYIWNEIIDEKTISIIKSALYFSLYYIKSPLFQKEDSFTCLKRLTFCCSRIVLIVVALRKNSSDEHFNLIKSLLKDSGWIECLFGIFNVLGSFSLSSKRIPPFLSFLSSIFPSEIITDILNYVSSALLLLGDATEEIFNFLISFEKKI
jgi:hypothetical protein